MKREIVIKFDWANVVVAICLVVAVTIPVFLIDVFLPNFFIMWMTCGLTVSGWIWALLILLKFLVDSNDKN